MKIEPLVSIIVAVSTNEETIYSCVESIMEQSYHNLEVILVIDDLYDRINIICNNLALMDSRIRIVNFNWDEKNKEDIKISAFNEGLRHAVGTYITFVDSNDRLQRDMIRILLGMCIKYQCQIACCRKGLIKHFKPFYPSETGKVVVYRRNAAFMSRKFSDELTGKLFNNSLFDDFYLSSYILYRLYYKATRISTIDREMYFIQDDKKQNKDVKLQIKACMKHFRDRIYYFKDKERNLLDLSHEYYCLFLAGLYIYKFKNGADLNSLQHIFAAFGREYRKVRLNSITPITIKLQLGLLYHKPKLFLYMAKLLRINTNSFMFKNLNRL